MLPLLVISTPNNPPEDPADKVVVALVTVSVPVLVFKLKVPTVVVAAPGAIVGLTPGSVSLPRKVVGSV